MKIKNLILFITASVYSQAPAIEWQNRIGGSNTNTSYSSQQTSDGGFIIGGRSNSNISFDKSENSKGNYDYWVVKTNSTGIIEWDKTIGALSPNNNEQDWFFSIKQTLDNGFILCGYSDSPISGDKTENSIGGADFWIVKLNEFGLIQWDNTIGGTIEDVPNTISLSSDGGYLIGGYSTSNISGDKTGNNLGVQDYWIVKINNLGIVEWDKTIGGNSIDYLTSIIQTNDGGFLLGGNSNSNISGDKSQNTNGLIDYWIIKINNIGDILWQKTIGSSGSEYLSKVIQTDDNGYLLAGYSNSPISGDKSESSRGLNDFWIVKVDNLGNVIWDKTIGGNGNDDLFDAKMCIDNGFILTGSSSSNISGEKADNSNGESDSWIIKTDSFGNIIWQKTIGGLNIDGFNSVSQTSDGGFFLSGVTNSIISGDIIQNPKGIYDYWLTKLTPENLSNQDNLLFSNTVVYPNPTNDIFNINFNSSQEKTTIEIKNILDQNIQKETIYNKSNYASSINGQIGLYYIKITDKNNKSQVFKILKK